MPQPPDDRRRDVLDAIRTRLAEDRTIGPIASTAPERAEPVEGRASDAGRSTLDRFAQALESVGGHCPIVRDVAEAASTLREILARIAARRIAASDSPLVRQVLAGAAWQAEVIEPTPGAALFACDAGITSAQGAIAETGTLVLESSAERHRLASLVPPVHIVLLDARRIRATLADIIHDLSIGDAERMSRCVTFITGPSRTSDIELTLAIGVHGPGELHVVVLEHCDG